MDIGGGHTDEYYDAVGKSLGLLCQSYQQNLANGIEWTAEQMRTKLKSIKDIIRDKALHSNDDLDLYKNKKVKPLR